MRIKKINVNCLEYCPAPSSNSENYNHSMLLPLPHKYIKVKADLGRERIFVHVMFGVKMSSTHLQETEWLPRGRNWQHRGQHAREIFYFTLFIQNIK